MPTSKNRLVAPPRRDLSSRRLRRGGLLRFAAALLTTALLGTVLLGLSLLPQELSGFWVRSQIRSEALPFFATDRIGDQSVTPCFTPAQACANLIVDILNHAQSQIRVQAYGFTSLPILSALVSAERRGVNVAVILDKSDDQVLSARSGGAEYVAGAGIPVFIDRPPGIAHNKVIVIDKHIVVTGSFNFTGAAEYRNVENVTTIDSPRVASQFLSNWESRRAVSTPFIDGRR